MDDKSFRLSPERFEELNKILGMYVGTKNFHNFTVKKDAQDPSAKRFIMSFDCQQPFVPDNTEVEFVRLKVKGQSFMLHQIRRMVGLVIAIMRGYTGADMLERAFDRTRILMPQAPGLGLVLDNVHYPRYDERYGSDGMHEPLLFKEQDEVVEEFFRKNILSTIIETELRDQPMQDWIGRLRNHSYEHPPKGAPDAEDEKDSSDKDADNSD